MPISSKEDLWEVVKDSFTNSFLPGKAIQDSFIQSDFNKKYNVYAYDPRIALFSPLDFTPVGPGMKVGKGVYAVYRGKKLISLGFSGFGVKKVKEGTVKIFAALGSKIATQFGVRSISSSSYDDFTSPDSPESYQQGEDSGHKKVSRSKQARCPPGYRRVRGKCVKQ